MQKPRSGSSYRTWRSGVVSLTLVSTNSRSRRACSRSARTFCRPAGAASAARRSWQSRAKRSSFTFTSQSGMRVAAIIAPMQTDTGLLYTLAAIGLSLSPGPNSLLAMTHGALHGTRMAVFTIAGGLAGFTLLIALSMFGIAALIESSIVWLTILKWVGGAYLV